MTRLAASQELSHIVSVMKIIITLLHRLTLTIVLTGLSASAFAQSTQDSEFAKLFQAGIQQYQSQNYLDAQKSFESALTLQPLNSSVLTNLALAEFKLDKKGLSLAHLRQSYALDPSLTTTQKALLFIQSNLKIKELPREIQTWELLRAQILIPLSLNGVLALTAMCLLFGSSLLIRYFSLKKNSEQLQQAPPKAPVIAIIILVIFSVSFILSICKIYDSNIPRATVIVEKAPVYIGPDAEQGVLFELFEGLEVVLIGQHEKWVQITYPGGMTGWVLKEQVLQTQGNF